MKNIFDPFGVLSEWKGQEPEDDSDESWAESIAQDIINNHFDNLSEMIADSVYAGIAAERERIVGILNEELSAAEVQRIIRIIESGDE